MAQTWHDLLFAHWPIEQELLRPLIPANLSLDTFDGQAWVAIAPFRMSGIRARRLPPLPGTSRFPELNLRTYVTHQDKPGVYFFSLDAGNLPAVWAARRFYHLPYFHAEMSTTQTGEKIIYSSARRGAAAAFRAVYRPIAPVKLRERGTLEHWLTERYCLYAVNSGRIFRAEIHHAPWPLQDAEAQIELNTMATAAGIFLPSVPPLLHFAKKLEVIIWPLRSVGPVDLASQRRAR